MKTAKPVWPALLFLGVGAVLGLAGIVAKWLPEFAVSENVQFAILIALCFVGLVLKFALTVSLKSQSTKEHIMRENVRKGLK